MLDDKTVIPTDVGDEVDVVFGHVVKLEEGDDLLSCIVNQDSESNKHQNSPQYSPDLDSKSMTINHRK